MRPVRWTMAAEAATVARFFSGTETSATCSSRSVAKEISRRLNVKESATSRATRRMARPRGGWGVAKRQTVNAQNAPRTRNSRVSAKAMAGPRDERLVEALQQRIVGAGLGRAQGPAADHRGDHLGHLLLGCGVGG